MTKVRKSFRELGRRYSTTEKNWEFTIEVIAFAIICAISAWPLKLAADALHDYLRS
jgi:hypothetical protein